MFQVCLYHSELLCHHKNRKLGKVRVATTTDRVAMTTDSPIQTLVGQFSRIWLNMNLIKIILSEFASKIICSMQS